MKTPAPLSRAINRRQALARLRLGAVAGEPRPLPASSTRVNLARAWHGRCLPLYLVAGVAAWSVSGPVLAILVCSYLALLRHALRARTRRQRAMAAGLLSAEACAGIAEDLRVGRSGNLALVAAVDTVITGLSQLRPACSLHPSPCRDCQAYLRSIRSWRLVREAAAIDGVGVVAALRAVGDPHRFWCKRLAAAWQLHESGMPLVLVLDGLEDELASQRRLGQTQLVHTAAARATAVVLAGLPLLGLGVGYAMGSDPTAVLLHTPLGACCALIATLLHCGGWVWADAIANRGATDAAASVAGHIGGALPRWLRTAPQRVARRRLRALHTEDPTGALTGATGASRTEPPNSVFFSRPGARWVIAALVGVATGWLVGTSVLGVGVGTVAAVAVIGGLRQLATAQERTVDQGWLEQFPYALIMLSSVLGTGAATAQSLSMVGRAIGERLGVSLQMVGTAMAQGEPIPVAWERAVAETPATTPLLRALRRSDASGAALAGSCRRLAGQLREGVNAQATAAASKSSVWMIAPLMCCFLPAFVLLGVVPVIVGILSQTLGATL